MMPDLRFWEEREWARDWYRDESIRRLERELKERDKPAEFPRDERRPPVDGPPRLMRCG